MQAHWLSMLAISTQYTLLLLAVSWQPSGSIRHIFNSIDEIGREDVRGGRAF